MAISIARALAHATSLLIKAGVNEVNSEKTARAIVTSDVWGNPWTYATSFLLAEIESGRG
jgi:LDH2 family malate/lactate/ureidoglycolate dehydrogenase